tara:strand:- start:6304 stop:6702 length:399 start_codon:yes stop_codon:yes gene_type:complete
MGKAIKLDKNKVRMLASFGCTLVEIAKYFKVGESVIRKKYKKEYEAGVEEMKFSLRKAQWKYALENGNTALLIFLGKNYLQQTDKSQLDLVGNLETVLKECGYENNDKADTQQEKALEDLGIQPDTTTVGHS